MPKRTQGRVRARHLLCGYKTQTVRWTGTPLTITLEDEMTQLSGVVVTALGIRREKKALGYAMQDGQG